jgi:hypothetical protein
MSKYFIESSRELPGNKNYIICINGKIYKKLEDGSLKKIRQRTNDSGYKYISIKRAESSFVHRLMAMAFLDNSENKKSVDHIDRIRSNNNLSNLRWATDEENNNNRERPLGRMIEAICNDDKDNFKTKKIFKSIAEASDWSGQSRYKIKKLLKNNESFEFKGKNYKWHDLSIPDDLDKFKPIGIIDDKDYSHYLIDAKHERIFNTNLNRLISVSKQGVPSAKLTAKGENKQKKFKISHLMIELFP